MRFSEDFFPYLQAAVAKRERSIELLPGLVDQCQVVKALRVVRMLCSKPMFADAEALQVKRLCTTVISDGDVECRQVVETLGVIRMAFAKELSS